jgi:hypothetical protein
VCRTCWLPVALLSVWFKTSYRPLLFSSYNAIAHPIHAAEVWSLNCFTFFESTQGFLRGSEAEATSVVSSWRIDYRGLLTFIVFQFVGPVKNSRANHGSHRRLTLLTLLGTIRKSSSRFSAKPLELLWKSMNARVSPGQHKRARPIVSHRLGSRSSRPMLCLESRRRWTWAASDIG